MKLYPHYLSIYHIKSWTISVNHWYYQHVLKSPWNQSWKLCAHTRQCKDYHGQDIYSPRKGYQLVRQPFCPALSLLSLSQSPPLSLSLSIYLYLSLLSLTVLQCTNDNQSVDDDFKVCLYLIACLIIWSDTFSDGPIKNQKLSARRKLGDLLMRIYLTN